MPTTDVDVHECPAPEKRREVEALLVSRASVRWIRRALDLPAQHRARRTPAARMDALVRLDGSPLTGPKAGAPL